MKPKNKYFINLQNDVFHKLQKATEPRKKLWALCQTGTSRIDFRRFQSDCGWIAASRIIDAMRFLNYLIRV